MVALKITLPQKGRDFLQRHEVFTILLSCARCPEIGSALLQGPPLGARISGFGLPLHTSQFALSPLLAHVPLLRLGDSCTTQPIEDSQRKLAVRSWASNKVGLANRRQPSRSGRAFASLVDLGHDDPGSLMGAVASVGHGA
jgi:hypothetical protein